MPRLTRIALFVLVVAVGTRGANSAEPLADLAQWLNDLKQDDPVQVVTAADALGARGTEASAALPELSRLLNHDHADIRAAAARAVGHIGVADPALQQGLLEALSDKRVTSRGQSVRLTAAWAIGQLQLEVMPELVALLEDEPMHVRRAAAVALYGYGPEAKAAVPALIQLLKEEDPGTRREAIYGLMGIGPAAGEAVPALIELLSSENFHTQYWACRALGRIGAPAAKPAVPHLIRLLHEGVASVRRNAASALGAIGPTAGIEILEPLTRALEDPSYTVRQAAAVALGMLGDFAQPAAPALRDALANQGFAARTDAAVALFRITGDHKRAIAVLVEELQSKSTPWEAAEAFEMLADVAQIAVPQLRKLLHHEAAETRLYATIALGNIGNSAQAALPDLCSLLKDPEQEVRSAAAEAIQRIKQVQSAP